MPSEARKEGYANKGLASMKYLAGLAFFWPYRVGDAILAYSLMITYNIKARVYVVLTSAAESLSTKVLSTF